MLLLLLFGLLLQGGRVVVVVVVGATPGGNGELLRGDPGEFLDKAGDTFFRGVKHWVQRTALA